MEEKVMKIIADMDKMGFISDSFRELMDLAFIPHDALIVRASISAEHITVQFSFLKDICLYCLFAGYRDQKFCFEISIIGFFSSRKSYSYFSGDEFPAILIDGGLNSYNRLFLPSDYFKSYDKNRQMRIISCFSSILKDMGK